MVVSAALIITLNKASLNSYITYWMSGESLPMLMLSLGSCVFVFNKPPKENNFISSLSKGTFDVYLIHMNHFVYLWLWNKVFNIQGYYETSLFLIKLIGVSIVVFAVCLIIGNIRKISSDYLWSKIKIDRLEKFYKKVDLALNFEK